MVNGITNAVIVKGGSGGGDTVIAKNAFGELVEGKKVYLSPLNYDTSYNKKLNYSSWRGNLSVFMPDDGFAYLINNSDILNKINLTDNTELGEVGLSSGGFGRIVVNYTKIGNAYYLNPYLNDNDTYKYENGTFTRLTKISNIFKGGVAIRITGSTRTLCYYDVETGTAGSNIIELPSSWAKGVLYDEVSGRFLYQAGSYSNQPNINLRSVDNAGRTISYLNGAIPVYENTVAFCTGLGDGDYIFLTEGRSDKSSTFVHSSVVVKIGTGGVLSYSDEGLPDSLREMLPNCFISYNQDSKILCACGNQKVMLYRYINNQFEEITINFTNLAKEKFNDWYTLSFYMNPSCTKAIAFDNPDNILLFDIVDKGGELYAFEFSQPMTEKGFIGFTTGRFTPEGVEVKAVTSA